MNPPTNKTWALLQIRHELSYKQDMIPPTNNWGYRRMEYRFHEEIERKSQQTRNSECRFDIQDHLIMKANIIPLFTWSKCCHHFILCWRTILYIFGNHLKLPVFVPIFCIEGENDNSVIVQHSTAPFVANWQRCSLIWLLWIFWRNKSVLIILLQHISLCYNKLKRTSFIYHCSLHFNN